MKASTYVRRHRGEVADGVLEALMRYHGCSQHNGPGAGACLADLLRTDLVMDVLGCDAPAERDPDVPCPVCDGRGCGDPEGCP